MNHRAQVRAMQDHVLRDSLAGSSMSALTLCVAALLAARLFATPVPPTDPPVVVEWPPRVFDDFVPKDPSGGGIKPPVDPNFVAVEHEPADSTVAPDPPVIDTGTGEGIVLDSGSSSSVGPGSMGSGGPPAVIIPPPDTYVWRDEDPKIVVKVDPEYPGIARNAGIEGRVRVRMFVGTDGRVHRAEIVGAASVFDASALAAVRQWIFTPAKAGEHPVGVWIDQPILFRLD